MKVTLSKETLELLKLHARIGTTIKIREGQDFIAVVGGDVVGIGGITESFPRDVNIYNVNELLALLSTIKEPTLDLSTDGIIYIESPGLNLRYIEGNGNHIKSMENRPTADQLPTVDVTFELGSEDIKQMTAIGSTLKFDYVGFKGENGKIYFTGFNKNIDSDNQEMSSLKIELCDNTSDFSDFCFTYARDVLNNLTNSCSVRLSRHLVSVFVFDDADRDIFVTAKKDKGLSYFTK